MWDIRNECDSALCHFLSISFGCELACRFFLVSFSLSFFLFSSFCVLFLFLRLNSPSPNGPYTHCSVLCAWIIETKWWIHRSTEVNWIYNNLLSNVHSSICWIDLMFIVYYCLNNQSYTLGSGHGKISGHHIICGWLFNV